MSDRELLFNRFDLQELLRHMGQVVPKEILDEKRDYLLSVNEENYISHVVDKHTIEPLVLNRGSIEIAH